MKKEILKNQSGIGLIACLAIVAFISLMIVGLDNVTVSLFKEVSRINDINNLHAFTQNINQSLRDSSACTNAMSLPLAMTAAAQDVFQNANGSLNINGGQSITLRHKSQTLSSSLEINQDNVHLRINSIKIYNASRIIDGTGSDYYRTQIVMSYALIDSQQLERALSPESLGWIYFEVNDSNMQILRCLSTQEISTTTLQNNCDAVDGDYDPSTETCDAVTPLCQSLGGTMSNGNCQL